MVIIYLYTHTYKDIFKCALSDENRSIFYISYCLIVKLLFKSQFQLKMSFSYSFVPLINAA